MAKDLTVSILLDFYGKVLTDKQRELMEQYYDEDLSLGEIADNFGITRQGVRDAIKRGENTLLDLEAKLGFAARYQAIQQNLEQMEQLTKDICFYNNDAMGGNAQIDGAAKHLLALIAQLGD